MKMDQILEQVDGAIGIADDVVVYAKSEEHDKILHRLMYIAAENDLVFNSTKCKIKSKSISFFGMIHSENGVSPDLEKLRPAEHAVPNMQKRATGILRSYHFPITVYS